MNINNLSSDVIKAAISVHKELGPGLLESVYRSCMSIELSDMGLNVKTEVPIPVIFRGREITDQGFRIGLIVENILIVELKSVDQVKDIHKKQLLTYLKLTRMPLGLLVNFNEALLKDGITRIIN
jgi:GxxExxY protein